MIDFAQMSSFLTRTCLRIAPLLLAAAAAAQAQTPTPEQLQMLQSLPPEQRAAVLDELRKRQSDRETTAVPEFPDVMRPEAGGPDAAEPESVRIDGGETLVITFDASELDDAASAELRRQPALAALAGTRTWELTDAGDLILPGVATIPLAGLDADDVTLRLQAEPALSRFTITAQILPLAAVGVDALEYFGYELFSEVPTTFAPATDVPVPVDYVMGPGDQLIIEYFGKENRTISAAVTRDGAIVLPEIGPVTVAGLTFDAARGEIIERVSEQKIGVRASVTMGELRSIRIFVLGDVKRPLKERQVKALHAQRFPVRVQGHADRIDRVVVVDPTRG